MFGTRHLACFAIASLGAWGYLDLPVSPRHHLPEPTPQAPQPPRDELPPLVPRPLCFMDAVLPAASRVVYVVDFSSSMTPDRWRGAKRSVAQSLRALSGEFHLLVFDCNVRRFSDEWSTDADSAIAWLESLPNPWERGSGTGTAQALLYALRLGGEAIVLATDGAPGACGLEVKGEPPYVTHARVIRQANSEPTPIHTFVWPVDEFATRFGRQVASDSGGVFVRAS